MSRLTARPPPRTRGCGWPAMPGRGVVCDIGLWRVGRGLLVPGELDCGGAGVEGGAARESAVHRRAEGDRAQGSKDGALPPQVEVVPDRCGVPAAGDPVERVTADPRGEPALDRRELRAQLGAPGRELLGVDDAAGM